MRRAICALHPLTNEPWYPLFTRINHALLGTLSLAFFDPNPLEIRKFPRPFHAMAVLKSNAMQLQERLLTINKRNIIR